MNEQFFKILSKTRMNKLIYIILKNKCKKKTIYNKSYHSNNIENLRKDSQSSCIVKRNDDWDRWEYDLDIIVPVYNVGKYLEECIESVIQQKTKYSYKLILVNDGSTDEETIDILELYKNNPYVVVLAKENGGISSARNIGLEKSKGKYIMFLDADDILFDSAIEKMVEVAERESANLVEGAYKNISEEGDVLKEFPHVNGVISNSEYIYGYPWGKVFSRDIFNSVEFPKYCYEDSIIKTIVCARSGKKVGISNYIYGYRRNRRGISFQSQGSTKSIDSFWISKQLNKDRITLGISNDQDYYEYMLNIIKLTFRRTISLPDSYKLDLFKRWLEVMEDFDGYKTKNSNMADLEMSLNIGSFELYKIWNMMKMF